MLQLAPPSLLIALLPGCELDTRKLVVTEGDASGMDDGAPVDGAAGPNAGERAAAGDGGCADLEQSCTPAGAPHMEQVHAMLRMVIRAPAFAACLNATMRDGSGNAVTSSADSVPSSGCGAQSPPYEQDGYGPYVSCAPEPDLERAGQRIRGTSNGEPAWNELIDRQLSRAFNALQVDVDLFPTAAAPDTGVRHAGYDPGTGISHVSYSGSPQVLTLAEILGEDEDRPGFLPDVVRASLHNLGYDHGCHPDGLALGSDRGNCGRDPGTWHPRRALDNIAAFCAKEILLRSADANNTGCGTEERGPLQTLRPCEQQGLMLIASYVDGTRVSCHCVPDPAAFGANTQGDRFGAALAAADFDGDGLQDLAVGAPKKELPGVPGRGAVFLYRGSKLGLRPWRSVSSDELGFSPNDAACGTALAVGDFNGDADKELVVGCPGLDSASGGVAILPFCREPCAGSVGGPQIERVRTLLPETPGEFGLALAVGTFLGDDALDDLLVGAPSASSVAESAGRVELHRGVDSDEWVDFHGAIEGPEAYARFGAALAIGNVQAAPGDELLVGAPGPAAAGGSVIIRSTAGTTLLKPGNVVAGAGFGSAIAIGDLVGDELEDIVITAPGLARLYVSTGASERPEPPEVVVAYPAAAPATAVAVIPAHDLSSTTLVLAGQPSAGAATLYRPSGSELVIEERLGQRARPFWSTQHDARDGGNCSQRGDVDRDVPCAIDEVTLAGLALGSAVGSGDFGMGLQYVLGAPDESLGGAPGVEAGAVYVRGGARAADTEFMYTEPLEYRLDQEAILYAGSPYPRGFGAAVRWHDDVCQAGETCLTRRGPLGTDVVVISRDTPGKEGDVWVAASMRKSFGPLVRWHDAFCSGQQICAVGDVDHDGCDDLISFVRDALAGHEHHVHVLRCAAGEIEEWHDDFCRAGNVCLVGSLGTANGRPGGDDIAEFDPQRGVRLGFADADAKRFVVSKEVSDTVLCADGHTCLLADVDGDTLSDVVEFYQGDSGEVRVALNMESVIAPARRWHASFCTAGEVCRAGDVNGDGLSDIVSFAREATPGREGEVWVSLSNGMDFGPAERWHTDLCRDAQICHVADVNGDRRSDAVVFVGPGEGSQAYDAMVALTPSGPKQALDASWATGPFTWSQGQSHVPMKPVSSHVCVLTKISGDFAGEGEEVKVHQDGDFWFLGGTSLHSGVGGTAYCFAKDKFLANGSARMISGDEISASAAYHEGCGGVTAQGWWGDATTILNGVRGLLAGFDDHVSVMQSHDAFRSSTLHVNVCNGYLSGQAHSFFAGTPHAGLLATYWGDEYSANSSLRCVSGVGVDEVAMAPVNDAMCHLIQIGGGGNWEGSTEFVEIYPKWDGDLERWFLRAHSGSCDSRVTIARARCYKRDQR